MDQNNAPVVRVGDWVLTILLLAIPIVNLVMLFVWALAAEPIRARPILPRRH